MKIKVVSRPVKLSLPAGETQLKRILQNMETISARAALYGVTDNPRAQLFASEGVELDFAAGYYRRGYEVGFDLDALSGWSFARALAGTAKNASGLLDSFASGAPKITDRGLLVEPERSNRVLYSQDFDNAAWTKYAEGTGVTPVVTANAALAPDGTMTADRVTLSLGGGTTGNDWSMLFPSAGIPIANASVYWGRVWVKGTSGEKIAHRHVGGGAVMTHTFSGEWEEMGRAETSISTSGNFEIGLRGGRPEPVSDTVTFDVWGAQLELGNYPTSYIPTTNSADTRPKDNPFLSGLNIQNGGSVYVEFSYVGAGSTVDPGSRLVFALAGDSNGTRAPLFNTATGVRLTAEIAGDLAVEANSYAAPFDADVVQRVAVRIAQDDSRLALDGTLGIPDFDCDAPAVLTRLGLGQYPWGDNQGGVVLKKVVVFPFSLTDRELAALTGGAPLPDVATRWEIAKTAAAFPIRDSARTFRIGGQQFVANGYQDGDIAVKDIWKTADGINFDLVNASPPYEDWSTVISVGAIMYAFKTAMWRSLDGGTSWTEIISTLPFEVETDSPALVLNGTLLAFPGTGLSPDADNGVWSYNAGTNSWTQIYTAEWGPRSIPVVWEVDGNLYLYGGVDNTTPAVPPQAHYPGATTLNDLWTSTDGGVTWSQIIADMPFQPRIWPTPVVLEGVSYLIGGFDPNSDPQSNFDTTFASPDCLNWSPFQVSETFVERHAASAYVFNGEIYLAAGKANRAPNEATRNDIWKLVTA